MNDMVSVTQPRTDQINADTLISGPMTVTIKSVAIAGGTEQPVTMRLEQTPLFYRPCKSMSRLFVALWGPDAKEYVGRSLTLYRDSTVKWAGMEVGGIRISHMSHIDREHVMALTASKGSRKPFKVLPLRIDPTESREALQARTIELSSLLLAGAEAAAAKGTEAFDAFVKACTSPDKAALKNSGKGAELRAVAKAADSGAPTDTAEHF